LLRISHLVKFVRIAVRSGWKIQLCHHRNFVMYSNRKLFKKYSLIFHKISILTYFWLNKCSLGKHKWLLKNRFPNFWTMVYNVTFSYWWVMNQKESMNLRFESIHGRREFVWFTKQIYSNVISTIILYDKKGLKNYSNHTFFRNRNDKIKSALQSLSKKNTRGSRPITKRWAAECLM